MANSYYVLPFNTLLQQVGISSADEQIALSKDQLKHLLQKLLMYVPVDEDWYLRTYPDVDQAIQSGAARSAKEHFVLNGYFEGRKPGQVVVDQDFYLKKYPDVAEGIEYGEIESAQLHFEQHGFKEGRLPHPT